MLMKTEELVIEGGVKVQRHGVFVKGDGGGSR